MKNNSNIYDIDGNLIREIDDVHTWTIEETQAKIDEYKEKLKELEENDPENSKIAVYRTYIANLHKYLFELYSKMSPEEIQAALNASKAKEDTKEQINNAINELKKEIENETEDTTETDNEPERTEEATGRTEDGVKAGLLKIRVYRPFPGEEVANALSHLKAIAVLDRAESLNGIGGALFEDVSSSMYVSQKNVPMVNYIYGIGGRDTTVKDIESVYADLSEIASKGKVKNPYRYLGLRREAK